MPRRLPKKTSSTPHLDVWIRQTLQHRAEVEAWCRENNIPYKKPEVISVSSKESGFHHIDPEKLPGWVARKRAGSRSASRDVTAETRLSELLELLWADTNLWQSVHDEDSPSRIDLYISQKHGLRFPKIPLAVWREIARHPGSRDRLLRLHRDEGEIALDGGGDFRIVWCALQSKLPEAALGELFWKFLYEPALDHRHLIASLQLSVDELETLRLAALRFARELEWCAVNQGIVPPQLTSNPRHRKSDVERARTIEAMVTRLLENPGLSNYQLAASSPDDPKDAGLKMAAEARRLVQLRERKPVARFSEVRDGRTIGHKPRRSP